MLLERAAEVTAKRPREALLAQADNARLSRELVTIKRDVPIELDVGDLTLKEPDRAAAIRILTELEFFSLARKLAGQGGGPGGDDGADDGGAAEDEASPAPVATLPLGDAESGNGNAGGSTGFTAGDWLAIDETPTLEVKVLDDVAGIPALVERLRSAPLVGLDAKTTSTQPQVADLVGLGLSATPTEVWYLPFGHRTPGALGSLGEGMVPSDSVTNLPPLSDPAMAPLAALLRDPAVPKAGHDIKRHWQVLRRAGVELAGVVFDTMLASFILDPGRRSHAIDNLCLEHLGRTMKTHQEVVGRGRTEIPFAEVAVLAAADYCGADSATVLALHDVFAPALREMQMDTLLRDVEMPLVEVLVDMEWEGINVDRALFTRLGEELGADLRRLEIEISQVAGVDLNINSPRQLATILFDKQQLPVLKKTKTGPSTDADVLEQLAAMGHDLPRLILEYRELQKLKSTYVDTLPATIDPKTGRIHTTFNQAGAATGRLSSSDPNLQNIPVRTSRGEEIRRGFIPRAGWTFLVADYSQIELRLMAHLSGDPAFIEAFNQGGDIHRQTAALIFNVSADQVTPEMRAAAKTVNFATIYGQGPFALSRQLSISLEDARSFIARYFERFAGVRAFLDRSIALAREQGYVETIFKRRRYIPEIRDRNFNMRAYGERNAQNSPLQGSAADLIKVAMTRIHHAIREEGLRGRMLLQVHDELVFEVPPEELERLSDLVRSRMEGVVELRVPLVVDLGVGANWLEAKH